MKKLRTDFWTKCVSFYLDGVGFTHKYKAMKDEKSSESHDWPKRNVGLSITAKGKKERIGGRTAHFFVGTSYTKNAVLHEQHFEKINGTLFANIARNTFSDTLAQSVNPKNKLILQDGDPSQNSKVAQYSCDESVCKIFSIPRRSADLNPIEIMFNIVRRQLKEQAVAQKIIRETIEKFSARIVDTLKYFPIEIIKKVLILRVSTAEICFSSKLQHNLLKSSCSFVHLFDALT